VIIGNTRADCAWKVFYEKELDVRYSRSYGPGRYDPAYEWAGVDYPIGYVRWTEGRNFESVLHLMKTGDLKLDSITTRRVPFQGCLEVYRDLMAEGAKDIGVVMEYATPAIDASANAPALDLKTAARSRGAVPEIRLSRPATRLDVIGAGNFARTMLLPHLQGKVPFGTVVNQTALSANHVKTKFAFAGAGTSHEEVLQGKGGENAAVLIATRHHLHAPLVTSALAQGRHVFVEKPLCLTRGELAEIDVAMSKTAGSVQVGFNRRFAPASLELKKCLAGAAGPKSASFRVMAGKLDPTHWYSNYAESGGRVLGEACHFFDYFCFLFDSAPVRVSAQTTWPATGRLAFPDTITAQVEFADGSSGQLIYSAEGDTSWPKEELTVFGAGFVAGLQNYQKLVLHRGRKEKSFSYLSKGHAEQMAEWASFLRGERSHPLPYALSRQSMCLTFAALESIQQGRSIEVRDGQ
jgi:predicted dehydrogenase